MDDKKTIKSWITDFVSNYQTTHKTETRWRDPLVGFADAKDPMYLELKEIIGPSHALPDELVPDARSVIVYFIPFAESISKSNIPDEESSREWDYAYIETNNMLSELAAFLHGKITEAGFASSNLPPTYNYDKESLLSDWSHRSSAYIAGLGTFGIHNMIITESGCCGRFGTVITDWRLEPDPRSEKEMCLWKSEGTCGKCMSRCVNNAFSLSDSREVLFDKYRCNEQIYEKIIPQWPIGPGDTCGKCMCGVPCSNSNPSRQ